MDWRSATPPDVVADIDSLTQDSIEAAAGFLGERGAFDPFMLTIALRGNREIRSLGVVLPAPEPREVIRTLELPGDATELRARATVLDVVAREPFDGPAISVMIEHRGGFCSDLLVPYRLSEDALDVDMAGAHAATATPRLWGLAGDAGIDPDTDLSL